MKKRILGIFAVMAPAVLLLAGCGEDYISDTYKEVKTIQNSGGTAIVYEAKQIPKQVTNEISKDTAPLASGQTKNGDFFLLYPEDSRHEIVRVYVEPKTNITYIESAEEDYYQLDPSLLEEAELNDEADEIYGWSEAEVDIDHKSSKKSKTSKTSKATSTKTSKKK